MGRSFDRGGRSRKERERGKRRAFQQAERDREARQDLVQARRTQQMAAVLAAKRMAVASAQGASAETMAPAASSSQVSAQSPVQATVVAMPNSVIMPNAKPGFMTQLFRRLFKKSA